MIADASILDTSEISNIGFPCREVDSIKVGHCVVAAGMSHHLHQLGGRIEEPFKIVSGFFTPELRPGIVFLGGNPDRTVVGVAGPHSETADRLHRAVGDSDTVGSECNGFDEV